MDSSAEWRYAVRGIPASPAGLTCDRIELRVRAIELAERGWPIVPGTFWQDGQWVGDPDSPVRDHLSDGPTPIHRSWDSTGPAAGVADWWADRPYSLLVTTGTTVDAIEVDAVLGRRAAIQLRGTGFPVPILATTRGKWHFLVSGTSALREDLVESASEHGAEIHRHGYGNWVVLPPTAFPHGVVHWRVKPEVCSWELPTPEFVQDALHAALERDARPTRTTEKVSDVANLLMASR